jgi:hypothetical protein
MGEGPGRAPEHGQAEAIKSLSPNDPKTISVDATVLHPVDEKTKKERYEKEQERLKKGHPEPTNIPEDNEEIPPEVAAFEILPDKDLVELANKKKVKIDKKWTRKQIIDALIKAKVSPE